MVYFRVRIHPVKHDSWANHVKNTFRQQYDRSGICDVADGCREAMFFVKSNDFIKPFQLQAGMYQISSIGIGKLINYVGLF